MKKKQIIRFSNIPFFLITGSISTKGVASNDCTGVGGVLIVTDEDTSFGDVDRKSLSLIIRGDFEIWIYVFVETAALLFVDGLTDSFDGVDGGSVLRIVSINLNQPRICPGESTFVEDIFDLS